MNKQYSKNIVKFLSIIFNANYYPMQKKKIKDIAQGIFKDSKIVINILNEFVWFDEKYYIDSMKIFTVKNVANAIKKTMPEWENSSYIWSLCILYSSAKDKCLFYKSLKTKMNIKSKKYIANSILNEINNLDKNKYAEKGYNIRLNSFIDYKHLLNYYRPHISNLCINKLFSINRELNFISWGNIIELLPDNFLKFLCNFQYYFYKKPKKYYVKQVNKTSSDSLVSLAILNILYLGNNQRVDNNITIVFKQIFELLQKLSKKRCFYWYGLILSNMEYCVPNNTDIYREFEKVASKELLNLVKKSRLRKEYVSELIIGLNSTSRCCYLKHFIIFKEFIKYDKKLAIKIAKYVIADYKNKILSKDTYDFCFYSKQEEDYCNTVINAVSFLVLENKLNIYKFFNSLLSSVYVDKEDFDYCYSKLLNNKIKTLHIFIVAFFVFQIMKIKKFNIDEQYIYKLIKKYFFYLHNFIAHLDKQEWLSLSNILSLEIVISSPYIDEEIDYLYMHNNLNFEFLSFLLSKKINYKNYPDIYNFINNYFHRYNTYWDSYKIERWLKIWTWLKNMDNTNICLNRLPEWKQSEYFKSL